MKTSISALTLALAVCIATQQDAQNGNWYRVFPVGEFRAPDGRPTECKAWVCTPEIGKQLVSDLKARVSDMVVDYEHQTLNALTNGQPAPASGWANDFEWRDDGLYAQIKWTPKAKSYIDAEEYRYLSPVFVYDQKTGAVIELLHIALTNNPAIDGLTDTQAQAALSLMIGDNTMDLQELLERLRYMLNLPALTTAAELFAELDKLKAQYIQIKGNAATCLDLSALLADSKSVAVLTQQVATATAQAAATTPDPAKFVPIAALTAAQQEVVTLRAEVARLNASQGDKALDDLIQAALTDGRLLAAQEEWARDLGKTNIAALTKFLELSKPIAALSKTQTSGNPPSTTGSSGLTETELGVCNRMGITPEAYLAAQAK